MNIVIDDYGGKIFYFQIHELKAKCHKQKEEILSLTHTAELANQEQDVLVANINSDKRVLETLKVKLSFLKNVHADHCI